MGNFRTLIDRWPNLPTFAADIGVKYVTAQAMQRRDSVSAEHWPAMIAAAAKREIEGITLESLVEIKASRRAA